MSIKDQIRKKIEEWQEHAIRGMKNGSVTYHQGKVALCTDLLSFLDSLPEEPSCPKSSDDLEEEVERYIENERYFPDDEKEIVMELARHFAEWGMDHFRDSTKMRKKKWYGWREAVQKLNKMNTGIHWFPNLFNYLYKKGELEGLCIKVGNHREYNIEGIAEKARKGEFNYHPR